MRLKPQALLTMAVLHLGFFKPGVAAEFKAGDRITIAVGDTLRSDLYCAAQTIEILGVAQRDLIAAGQNIEIEGAVEENCYAAGQTIIIDGTVRGDLLACAAEVELNGSAESGIRAAAGTITIRGNVNGDLIITAGVLTITPEAVVNGDIIFFGGKMEVSGIIHGQLTGAAEEAVIAGTVDNDAELKIKKKLDLLSSAHIGGNLTYHHTQPLDFENTEVVAGDIIFKETRPDPGAVRWQWLKRIWFWLAAVIVGLVMVALGSQPLQNVLDRTMQRPLDTFGVGALALVATPVAVVLSFVLVFSIPLGLILLATFLVFSYLGAIMLGTLVGREILRLVGGPPFSLHIAAIVGITLIYALTFIPKAGWVLEILALISGLGMVTLGIYEAVKKTPVQSATTQ